VANHRVSGHLVPDAVSGHVALEIANTRAGWGGPSPREYLVSYDALAVWAGDVGLLSTYETRRLRALGSASPRVAQRVLDEVLALRESWYAVATSPWSERPFPRADLDVVGAAAARAAAESRLVPRPDSRVLPDGGDLSSAGLRLPANRVALAAYDVLTSGDVAHVGRCAGHGCGWLFFDPTHRRHWCIMAICGNRAKARAFAERRRAERRGAERLGAERLGATLTR
jgi:predicted RNA-binding Zn ribbon-like protein